MMARIDSRASGPTTHGPQRGAPQSTGRALLCATLLGFLAACSPSGPPSVLIVTFDTTRYDRIGPSGDRNARTPTLDVLAAEGLTFDRAYSPAGITLPAHTTIFTGFEPIDHGVHNNGRFTVPEDMETLAEYLRGAGFDTAAFVSAFVLDKKFNLDQGFELYSDETRKQSENPFDLGVAQRPAEEVTDEAIAWLDQLERKRPFLLWAHYYDPHFPRQVRPPFQSMLDSYSAEIAYADANFGRLLGAAREAGGGRELLVVFTADHGEAFGEHGEPTHAVLAYDSTLHVPLILSGPGIPKGARSDAFVRHVDILPTVLEAVGISAPPDLPGRSLLAAHRDGDGEEGSIASYFESASPRYEYGWAEIQGVRTSRWKYTALPEPRELYDVLSDPGEERDLIDEEPEVRARMAALNTELQEKAIRFGGGENPRPALDADERERLAALGYVEAPGDYGEGETPDPRRWVRALNLINSARGQARNGSFARALSVLEPLSRTPLLEQLAVREMAPIYRDRGRLEDAIDAYSRHLELTGSVLTRNELAETLILAGRPDDVLELIEEEEEGQGMSQRSRWLRARALTETGRHAEARTEIDRAFEKSGGRGTALRSRALLALQAAPLPDGEEELRGLLAEAPESAIMQSYLGFYLALWGRPDQREEASSLLETAAAEAPENPEIQSNLGWGSYRLGDHDRAIEALDKAVTLDSERYLDTVRLAQVLGERGDLETALDMLRRSIAAQPSAEWAGEARSVARAIRAAIAERDAADRDA